jgi:hypothetical protein
MTGGMVEWCTPLKDSRRRRRSRMTKTAYSTNVFHTWNALCEFRVHFFLEPVPGAIFLTELQRQCLSEEASARCAPFQDARRYCGRQGEGCRGQAGRAAGQAQEATCRKGGHGCQETAACCRLRRRRGSQRRSSGKGAGGAATNTDDTCDLLQSTGRDSAATARCSWEAPQQSCQQPSGSRPINFCIQQRKTAPHIRGRSATQICKRGRQPQHIF